MIGGLITELTNIKEIVFLNNDIKIEDLLLETSAYVLTKEKEEEYYDSN